MATTSRHPAPRRRRPLLSQVFAVNATVLVVAALLLALSPVTIHAPIAATELVLVLVTLVVMLVANLVVLRTVIAPLHDLTRTARSIDTSARAPGRLAALAGARNAEVAQLATAFDEMLVRLEEERRDGARRSLAAQEAERLRVARELHDEVGQVLTALALRAERAAQDPGAGGGAALAGIAADLQDALDEIRRIARELRPEALDDLGLGNALIALCARLDAESAASVAWDLDTASLALDPATELAVYRIAQEALTNALRHAGAQRIALTLRSEAGLLTLRVEDDGRGVVPGDGDGSGIAGMRERALLVGGTLTLGPGAAGGTVVALALPLREEPA